MLQQTHDSECHCCLIVKYLSQLHKQFISPIPLVKFNWYCKCGGDNDETLTCERDLINLFSPKDVYRCSLFFFLTHRTHSRALNCFAHKLADVFKKNKKKNKTTLRSFLFYSPMFSKRTKRKIKQCLCIGYPKCGKFFFPFYCQCGPICL